MTNNSDISVAAPAGRKSYHHGALRESLIAAAHELVAAGGLKGFTLADAARKVGVSTAAPYRHFADRQALLDAVCGLAFERLTERLAQARDAKPVGSIEAIVEMGKAYVRFVGESESLFELMWSRHLEGLATDETDDVGRRCFQTLLDAVGAYCSTHNLENRNILEIAMPLWVMVHGTASLVLGRNIDVVAPGIQTGTMLEQATHAYFAGLEAQRL